MQGSHNVRQIALGALLVASLLLVGVLPATAQDPPRVPPEVLGFTLPFSDPPGPNTWLYEQHYGNTTQAYNYGDVWYQFGQGMHFGLDLEAPCGTPVHAIADGRVVAVDSVEFGAGPHNIVLEHTGTGYTSIYGHLSEVPRHSHNDTVEQGDVLGVSGDPDGTCASRPHLHFEIRGAQYSTAFSPVEFIDVNWHMLTSIGPYNTNFQQALDHPRRWMRLEDQPEIQLGGNPLNNYFRVWPPKLEVRAPATPPRYRDLEPLPEDVTVTITPVVTSGWNVGAWWEPDDLESVYVIDVAQGGATAVMRQPLDGAQRQYVQDAPPALSSPDGSIAVAYNADGTIQLTRDSDGASWSVNTGGVFPAVSPGNTRLLWERIYGEIVPGSSNPSAAIWSSNLDGSEARRVYSWAGSYSMWLDDDRVLVIRRVEYTRDKYLYVVDLGPNNPGLEAQPLGTYVGMDGLRVSPGGEWIAYYLAYQDDPEASGVYVQRTEPGSQPRKLPYFGSYRWRDDDSLFMLSYDLDQPGHALGVVELESGELRWLTDPEEQPIHVANGEWSVSPDGTRILYLSPEDYGLYLIELE